jgi:hypothetical protein
MLAGWGGVENVLGREKENVRRLEKRSSRPPLEDVSVFGIIDVWAHERIIVRVRESFSSLAGGSFSTAVVVMIGGRN